MSYVILYTESADEVAANVAAVAESAGRDQLDLMDVTPEEYVEGWADLYVCDADNVPRASWSLGGVEPYEAHQFATRADAEAWLASHGESEPGEWTIIEL